MPLHRNLLKFAQAGTLAALAGSSAWPASLGARAKGLAEELMATDHTLLVATGDLLLAALQRQQGRLTEAATHLEAAAARIEPWSPVRFHCCQRQLGKVRGGAEGARLIHAADAVLRAEGITNPERWANMWAPGF